MHLTVTLSAPLTNMNYRVLGILPSLWFYWYSLVYQPPVFRFDIRMILWHHGGFLICFGCLHHQGGHRGHRRQQGRHDGAWWRGGLVYHFQNDSLTLRRLPDMSRMSPSPRWTTRASSSARSTWWSMGAGWSSFSSRGYCWQHQTCTRVIKTISFYLDYFLCWEVWYKPNRPPGLGLFRLVPQPVSSEHHLL